MSSYPVCRVARQRTGAHLFHLLLLRCHERSEHSKACSLWKCSWFITLIACFLLFTGVLFNKNHHFLINRFAENAIKSIGTVETMTLVSCIFRRRQYHEIAKLFYCIYIKAGGSVWIEFYYLSEQFPIFFCTCKLLLPSQCGYPQKLFIIIHGGTSALNSIIISAAAFIGIGEMCSCSQI